MNTDKGRAAMDKIKSFDPSQLKWLPLRTGLAAASGAAISNALANSGGDDGYYYEEEQPVEEMDTECECSEPDVDVSEASSGIDLSCFFAG